MIHQRIRSAKLDGLKERRKNSEKMKYLFYLILISLIITGSGCQTTKTYKPPTFSTYYGDIEKGFSMAEVMGVLGNPTDIYVIPQDNSEIWYFDLIEETVFVLFRNKEVAKVVSYADAFPTPFGDIKRGSQKEVIEEMLGEPYQKSFSKNKEIWCYRIDEEGRMFVFFKGDNATAVWIKRGVEKK